MAARFWVGGSGTWSTTNTANWSATSGGAGGASVPGAADDVTIDGNSGSPTITTNYNASVISVTINAAAATLSLGGTLTCSGAITLTAGTFTTNNNNVTASDLSSTNSNTRTINLGSSTVTLNGSNAVIAFQTSSNLTFNAGTSQINLTGTTTPQILVGSTAGSGATFYNVSFTGAVATSYGINGPSFTFNNLSFSAPSSAGVAQAVFYGPCTINGTLSTTGTAGNRRVWLRGIIYGLAQTLTINATPSLTDADFRDIYVIGTAAPISGTRIGDLRGIRGITASTPKTVYWNLAAGGNWSANAWAASSGAGVSTDNFPLAQDTAIIENTGLNVSATITLDSAYVHIGTIDMSTRTNAMTLAGSTTYAFYGNWIFGSGVTRTYSGTLQFSGRNTQTITSAGKSFSNNFSIDTYGGSVELADALNIGSGSLTVTNGTFDTKNYNVTAGDLSSSNSNVRTITLGSSTLTLTGVNFATSTNLTFNAGTSLINIGSNTVNITGGGVAFYDAAFTGVTAATKSVIGNNSFRNLTITAPNAADLMLLVINGNQTITGTLTVAGATAVRRIFVRSDTLGTTRTLTVGTLSATDCDFRDITIAGAAAGSSPTRAGNCGGNSGITFPGAKTVYWNLAGAQNWSATAWAPGSGGTPDINNFPLAQDTAVFDEAVNSVTGTITINQAWNIGTFNASARTSAMTLTTSTNNPTVYGDWLFGTGVTNSSTTGTITFATRGTETITSNGVSFGCPVTIDCATGTVQLADALSLGSTRNLALLSGTFDAVTYNVTVGSVLINPPASTPGTVKMGSGTWTLAGTAVVWNIGGTLAFYKGTANIVLSDTSTSSRTFTGGGFSYNKLTIGGTTGTSTLTITGNNQFTELASTKTVAHTIALGTTTQTFGKWTVTGTAGNVVTVTGTATITIAGACTSGLDYLALGTTTVSATSPGEFYAGANSTATSAAAPLYLTAKPADSTRYWVGGTGNWSDTARWSTGSGGLSGASVPRSHDDVVFDSASNATAYTATVNAVTGGIRMKSLTIAGPLTGNVTLAGSTAMVGIHGNVTLPATGLTRTYTGAMTLSSNSTGLTFTTNGVTLASAVTVNGVDCGWSLGSALDDGTSTITVTNGSLSLATYNLTAGSVSSNNGNSRTINFSTGTTTLSGTTVIDFGTTETNRANLTVTSSTSQINLTRSNAFSFTGNNQTFYNVSFTSTSSAFVITLNGANSFNNLSFTGITSAGVREIALSANQTVTGTLTLSAGTNATMRHFVRSDTIGTTRTITTAAFSGTDADFRDITISGAAAPVSGTRLGDCKGNSGITFGAGVTRYWNLAGSNNWSATGWAANAGDAPAVNNFPLAQDTCVFTSTSPGTGTTTTINAAYNIGTIDMQARTSNTMTLASSVQPSIYGNVITGSGVTYSGTGRFIFAGRTTQQFTSAGVTYVGAITVSSPGGSLVLQDALSMSTSSASVLVLDFGTFNANGYNVTLSGSGSAFSNSSPNARTVAVGSGTWTIAGSGTAWSTSAANLTVTGTGTISLTSASAKTFAGGGISYTNITLNQGGAGALTITGNNTFKDITNTYKATGATNITLGTTTQRVSQFTAAGESGRLLTIQGTSASSPGTLIHISAGNISVDYLIVTGVRAYPL